MTGGTAPNETKAIVGSRREGARKRDADLAKAGAMTSAVIGSTRGGAPVIDMKNDATWSGGMEAALTAATAVLGIFKSRAGNARACTTSS